MRRPLIHFIVLLALAATIPVLTSLGEKDEDIGDIRQASGRDSPLIGLGPHLAQLLWAQKSRYIPELSPNKPAQPLAAKQPESTLPNFSPHPSGLLKGVLPVQEGLSVRGIALGARHRELKGSHPPAEVSELGSGETPERGAGRRDGRLVTKLAFGEYTAYFDSEAGCGSVSGNGLERQGIPILAAGDGPDEVERLLGQPSGWTVTHSYEQADGSWLHDCDWHYSYPRFFLTINFHDDRVTRFRLELKGFADRGC